MLLPEGCPRAMRADIGNRYRSGGRHRSRRHVGWITRRRWRRYGDGRGRNNKDRWRGCLRHRNGRRAVRKRVKLRVGLLDNRHTAGKRRRYDGRFELLNLRESAGSLGADRAQRCRAGATRQDGRQETCSYEPVHIASFPTKDPPPTATGPFPSNALRVVEPILRSPFRREPSGGRGEGQMSVASVGLKLPVSAGGTATIVAVIGSICTGP